MKTVLIKEAYHVIYIRTKFIISIWIIWFVSNQNYLNVDLWKCPQINLFYIKIKKFFAALILIFFLIKIAVSLSVFISDYINYHDYCLKKECLTSSTWHDFLRPFLFFIKSAWFLERQCQSSTSSCSRQGLFQHTNSTLFLTGIFDFFL